MSELEQLAALMRLCISPPRPPIEDRGLAPPWRGAEARQAWVEAHLSVVSVCSYAFRGSDVAEFLALVQAGNTALVSAVDSLDEARMGDPSLWIAVGVLHAVGSAADSGGGAVEVAELLTAHLEGAPAPARPPAALYAVLASLRASFATTPQQKRRRLR